MGLQVVDDRTVVCEANDNATLSGLDFIVNFSGVQSSLPILSEKDVKAIRTFGKMYKIHFVNLSLCRTAEDIQTCRTLLDKYLIQSSSCLLIPKLLCLELD